MAANGGKPWLSGESGRIRDGYSAPVPRIDVVVVSFNSSAHLRACVTPLCGLDGIDVHVVDNASSDGSLDTIADLPVDAIRRSVNAGFAAGCNVGWRAGRSPYVLFLNPDATIDRESLDTLAGRLAQDDSLGAVAPRIEHPDGSLAWSQRRFPKIRSTYARALFLHRLFPCASWSDDLVRERSAYQVASSPDWLSGACLLVRRSALEAVDGWDEGFFLYGEDIDLCRRLRSRGYTIAFEPAARSVHVEGASSHRAETLPLMAASRIRYDRKHSRPLAVALDRIGIALGALTHLVVSKGGRASRTGHARALRVALFSGQRR